MLISLFSGFQVVDKGCCGTGDLEVSILCNQYTPVKCANVSDHIFWDSYHPTESAYKALVSPLLGENLNKFFWGISSFYMSSCFHTPEKKTLFLRNNGWIGTREVPCSDSWRIPTSASHKPLVERKPWFPALDYQKTKCICNCSFSKRKCVSVFEICV